MNDLFYQNRLRIGRNIARLRRANKMTQQDLADELNDRMGTHYKASAISAWENGNNSINSDFMPYFAAIFDIPLEKMFSRYYSNYEKLDEQKLVERILYDLNDKEREFLDIFVRFIVYVRESGYSFHTGEDDTSLT